MTEPKAPSYYLSRREDILDLYATHSRAWRPFLAGRYEDTFAEEIIREAREILEGLIPELPYIGGDDNPMTYHIIRCSTSLALYKAMKARGKSAEETGKIIYDAVVESVRHIPPTPPMTEEDLAKRIGQARISQERRYPGDWVRKFVEGDTVIGEPQPLAFDLPTDGPRGHGCPSRYRGLALTQTAGRTKFATTGAQPHRRHAYVAVQSRSDGRPR